jgi:hypothetical protein
MGLVKWDLWWTKWRWGRFSLSTSVSPANLHSTNCSTITLIHHLGLYNRPEVAALPGDVSPTPLKKTASAWCLLFSGFLFGLPFDLENDLFSACQYPTRFKIQEVAIPHNYEINVFTEVELGNQPCEFSPNRRCIIRIP